jgi:predicted nucleic acid-binding protein
MNKIIISDTSCLIALNRIAQLDILLRTFGKIYITKIVADEFRETLPEWIIVEKINNSDQFEQLQLIIDPGEASAIALALETDDAILIIDEKKGRKIAENLNIPIIGTLRVLLLAKERGAINSVKELILELQKNSFRFHSSIIDEVLRLANESD